MPLHQSQQHGKQTGGVGSHCAAGNLRPSCHYWNLVGWIPRLECNYWGLQAVQKGQGRKEMWRDCPLHQELGWVWRTISEEQTWAGWKPWTRTRGQGSKEKLVLVPTGYWCSLLAPATGGIVLIGSCPVGDLNHLEICWESCTVTVGNPGDSWNACRITSWPS